MEKPTPGATPDPGDQPADPSGKPGEVSTSPIPTRPVPTMGPAGGPDGAPAAADGAPSEPSTDTTATPPAGPEAESVDTNPVATRPVAVEPPATNPVPTRPVATRPPDNAADAPATAVLPAAPEADPAQPARDAAESPRSRRTRILLVALAAVLAIAGLLLAFFLGTLVRPGLGSADPATVAATRTPSPTPTPTPTPTPAPVAVPAGPVAPGVHAWDELGGGECLDPYTSPWEREFTVVDCAAPHPAQLTARGAFPGDAAAPYPGEQALTAQLNLLCTAPEVLDLGAAGQYSDLQFQGAYPAGEQQWVKGDRSWFCFVTRSSGQPLTGSVAAGR